LLGGAAGELRKMTAIFLSLAGALYVCITAIIAIPAFSDPPDRLKETLDATTSQLNNDIGPLAGRYDDRIKLLAAEWESSSHQPDVDTTRQRVVERWETQEAGTAVVRAADRAFLNQRIDDLTKQDVEWRSAADTLTNRIKDFDRRAKDVQDWLIVYFITQNHGRMGAKLTEDHGHQLTNSYWQWLADYTGLLWNCFRQLSDARRTIVRRWNDPDPFDQRRLSDVPDPPPHDFCNDPDNPNFPPRPDLSETLGYFGRATAWLIHTESRNLALIPGLLGFGFFGALARAFIQEFAAASGNELPAASFIVRALVSGVAAAVLVFLAVVGGIAMFTQSGPDPHPNPYDVFLACFIAAVFSEDVWKWARQRQQEQYGSGKT
jgi:hypothetical protein